MDHLKSMLQNYFPSPKKFPSQNHFPAHWRGGSRGRVKRGRRDQGRNNNRDFHQGHLHGFGPGSSGGPGQNSYDQGYQHGKNDQPGPSYGNFPGQPRYCSNRSAFGHAICSKECPYLHYNMMKRCYDDMMGAMRG